MLTFLFNILNDEEKSKLEKLYEHYKNLMMYIALDILKNKSLAEEVVQDAFINLLLIIDDIGEITCHKTYSLVVIVIRRVSFNKLKYEKKRNHESDKAFEYINSDEKILENIVFDKIKFEEIIEELKLLNKIDFEVIILKYYYGYTYTEIAVRHNLSPAATRKRCERTRKKILINISKK